MRPGRFDALDYAPVGICVIDQARTVLFWNRCIADWTSIPAQEIAGQDIRKKFARLDEERYEIRIDAVLEGGPPAVFSASLHGHLFPALLPGGEMRYLHVTVTAVPDEDDDVHQADEFHESSFRAAVLLTLPGGLGR